MRIHVRSVVDLVDELAHALLPTLWGRRGATPAWHR